MRMFTNLSINFPTETNLLIADFSLSVKLDKSAPNEIGAYLAMISLIFFEIVWPEDIINNSTKKFGKVKFIRKVAILPKYTNMSINSLYHNLQTYT